MKGEENTMFIETERTLLRKFREEDFADFCAYTAEEGLSRMMGRDQIWDEASARPVFDWLLHKEERAYVIVLKETGQGIGNLTVSRYVAHAPELQGKRGVALSFELSRAYRRQGLMTEVVRAVIRQLFTVEHMEFVNCGYFSFNEASRGLQEKLGFTYLTQETSEENGEQICTIETILWNEEKERTV